MTRPPAHSPLPNVKLLTVAETAQLMRLSGMSVYRLIHSGDLPALRIGRAYRIPEQAVQDYLQNAYIRAPGLAKSASAAEG